MEKRKEPRFFGVPLKSKAIMTIARCINESIDSKAMVSKNEIKTQLILICFVLGAITCFAQKPQSHTKSNRDDGFVIRPQVSIALMPILSNPNIILPQFQCTFAIQYSSFMSLGAGIGVDYYYHDSYYTQGENHNQKFVSLPFYLTSRFYYPDRKWSPFFEAMVGFHVKSFESKVNLTDEYNYFLLHGSYSDYYEYLSAVGGKWGVVLGVQYKNIDFSVSTCSYLIKCRTEYTFSDYDNLGNRQSVFRSEIRCFNDFSVSLNIAYNFLYNRNKQL